MLEAEQQGAKKRRLPRGTSEYQAAWITDDIIEGDDDVSEEEDAAENADDVRYNAVMVQPMMSLHACPFFAMPSSAKWLICHMRYSIAGRLLGVPLTIDYFLETRCFLLSHQTMYAAAVAREQ